MIEKIKSHKLLIVGIVVIVSVALGATVFALASDFTDAPEPEETAQVSESTGSDSSASGSSASGGSEEPANPGSTEEQPAAHSGGPQGTDDAAVETEQITDSENEEDTQKTEDINAPDADDPSDDDAGSAPASAPAPAPKEETKPEPCGNHTGGTATCTSGPICDICGTEYGSTLGGHHFVPATCTAPRTCIKCGMTTGRISQHAYRAATSTAPETCIMCGITRGESLGTTAASPAFAGISPMFDGSDTCLGGCEDYYPATCEEPSRCVICSAPGTDSALGHDFDGPEANCTDAQICNRASCDTVLADALGHDFDSNLSCEAVCVRTGCDERQDPPHTFDVPATCVSPATCSKCGEADGDSVPDLVNGHDYSAPATCVLPERCNRYGCGAAKPGGSEALGHTGPAPACTNTSKMVVCERCNIPYANTTDPVTHDFGSWEVVTPATETEDGEEKRTCKDCNTEETRPIPALGTNPDPPDPPDTPEPPQPEPPPQQPAVPDRPRTKTTSAVRLENANSTSGSLNINADGSLSFIGPDGSPVFGVIYANDAIYYGKADGTLATNEWIIIEGKFFFFDEDGAAVCNGWVEYDGAIYRMNWRGEMIMNVWTFVGGNWYWMKPDGKMAVNETITLNGITYVFDENGLS